MKTTTKKTAKKSNGAAATEAAPPSEHGISGPIFKDGVKHFSPVDLMRFELAQSRVSEAQKDIRLAQADSDQLRANFERVSKIMQDKHASALVALRQYEKVLISMRKEIEEVYKIDMNKITYNDSSGEIMIPPEAPPPEIPVS